MISIVTAVSFGPMATLHGFKLSIFFNSLPFLSRKSTPILCETPNVWIALQFLNSILVPFTGFFKPFTPLSRFQNVSATMVFLLPITAVMIFALPFFRNEKYLTFLRIVASSIYYRCFLLVLAIFVYCGELKSF